jgi:hypothetical protein
LQDAGTQQLSLAEKQLDLYQQQLDALDKQLDTAKAQLDALKGIDDSVISVAQALANFGVAVGNAQIAKANYEAAQAGSGSGGVSAAVEALYKSLLGRSSDAAGKAFWIDAITNRGASLSSVSQAIQDSSEYKAGHGLPSFDVGTNNVPEDMIAQVHKGERIIPAADNAELQRRLRESAKDEEGKQSPDVQVVLSELIEAVQVGDAATVRKFNEMFKVLQRWENDGMPPTRNVDA